MKKLIWTIVIIVILVAIGVVARRNNEAVTPTAFKMASVLPMTGDFGFIGEEVKRGADVAVAEARAEGIDVVYINEDDAFTPTQIVSAASKVLSTDGSDAVFTATVNEAGSMTHLFNTAKKPLLVAWDSNQSLKDAGDYVYSIGFSTEKAGEIMAEYAANELGVKKVAIINSVDNWSDVIAPAFRKKFESLGGTVVSQDRVSPDAKDYRTYLTKVKSVGVDALYFPLIPPGNQILLTQAQGLGLKTKMLTGDSFLDFEIEGAGKAAENVYLTDAFAMQNELMAQKYEAVHKTPVVNTLFASFGYDAAKTLIEAFKISQRERISIDVALTKVSFDGIGDRVNMNGTRYSERVEKVFKVMNGKKVLVQ